MKRKSLPVGILALALMLALGSLGVVYGYSQNLTATATVNTATFDVKFANAFSGKASGPGGAIDCTGLTGNGTQALSLTVANALPDEGCSITTDIVNNSSIPVTVAAPSFSSSASWLDGADSFGLSPYTIPAGQSLKAHSLLVFVNDTLNVNAHQSGTGTFTFVVSD